MGGLGLLEVVKLFVWVVPSGDLEIGAARAGGGRMIYLKKERNVRRDRSEFAQGGEFIDTGIMGVKKRRGSLC